MAVTLTDSELRAALRLGTTTQETTEIARLRALAIEMVERFAPDAPAPVQDESVVRVCGYMYDAPFASPGTRYSDPLRNSGAMMLLNPYRVHRAGRVDQETEEPMGFVTVGHRDIGTTATDIASGLDRGTYRAYLGGTSVATMVGVAYGGEAAPADDGDYFTVELSVTAGDPAAFIEFSVPGSLWVRRGGEPAVLVLVKT